MDTDQNVAKRLIALRKELGERAGVVGGYSQTEFARIIGMAKNTLNGFEKGSRPLTLEAARKIRRRFGISIDWILFGDMPQVSNDILLKMGPTPTNAPAPVRRSRSSTGG